MTISVNNCLTSGNGGCLDCNIKSGNSEHKRNDSPSKISVLTLRLNNFFPSQRSGFWNFRFLCQFVLFALWIDVIFTFSCFTCVSFQFQSFCFSGFWITIILKIICKKKSLLSNLDPPSPPMLSLVPCIVRWSSNVVNYLWLWHHLKRDVQWRENGHSVKDRTRALKTHIKLKRWTTATKGKNLFHWWRTWTEKKKHGDSRWSKRAYNVNFTGLWP